MNLKDKTTLRRVSAKDNPFAVHKTGAIPFDFQETPFANMKAFAMHTNSYNFHGAILGRHGNGKTTLLCDLNSWISDQDIDSELVFLPRERDLQRLAIETTVRRGQSGAIVLVDGLERLPFLSRQRLLHHSKSFSGFIATTHRSSRLRTLIHCRTTQQNLMAVLESLQLSQPDIVAAAETLFSKHRGNIRFVLRELYDQYADGKVGR